MKIVLQCYAGVKWSCEKLSVHAPSLHLQFFSYYPFGFILSVFFCLLSYPFQSFFDMLCVMRTEYPYKRCWVAMVFWLLAKQPWKEGKKRRMRGSSEKSNNAFSTRHVTQSTRSLFTKLLSLKTRNVLSISVFQYFHMCSILTLFSHYSLRPPFVSFQPSPKYQILIGSSIFVLVLMVTFFHLIIYLNTSWCRSAWILQYLMPQFYSLYSFILYTLLFITMIMKDMCLHRTTGNTPVYLTNHPFTYLSSI